MAKIGQSESTVDPQFNQLETMFKEQYGKMKKLTKFVQSYQAAIAGSIIFKLKTLKFNLTLFFN